MAKYITPINFEFAPPKVKAAAEKIISDCRDQNFTIRDFMHLVGELSQHLEYLKTLAEIERHV